MLKGQRQTTIWKETSYPGNLHNSLASVASLYWALCTEVQAGSFSLGEVNGHVLSCHWLLK